MTMMNAHTAWLAAVLFATGCAETVDDPDDPTETQPIDFRTFREEVYWVLIRDCGFEACHGDDHRLFRVWGPGRVRIPNELDMGMREAFAERTGDELTTTYRLALAMVDEDDPEQSLLLRKPLSVAAGGAGHAGVDKYGRDVYRTPQDQGYQVLLQWLTTPESPDPAADASPTSSAEP